MPRCASAEAAGRSDAWWTGLGAVGQEQFREQMEQLNADWDEVIVLGEAPNSELAQQMAACHVDWLGSSMSRDQLTNGMVKSITQMYVDDDRFAAHYNRVSPAGPQFVRDAVHHWADRNLEDQVDRSSQHTVYENVADPRNRHVEALYMF